MIYGTLHIPEEILEAKNNGKLVVFVGAGVSKGDPAGIPDFEGLVLKATGSLPEERSTSLEMHLGKLYDEGIPVHQQVTGYIKDLIGKEDQTS